VGAAERVDWTRADLGVWEPGTRFDLVTTHYAHPAMPQLDFYDRIAGPVAPGGTPLIVGHLRTHVADGHGHHDGPPAEATATAAGFEPAAHGRGICFRGDRPSSTQGAYRAFPSLAGSAPVAVGGSALPSTGTALGFLAPDRAPSGHEGA
jgi:hypothetical protein